jgi:diguanylate cyclase (GGDEF)-like protein
LFWTVPVDLLNCARWLKLSRQMTEIVGVSSQPPPRLSWLCQTRTHRERVLDMEERIKPMRAASFGLLTVALVGCGPWVGWWTILPLVGAGACFAWSNRHLRRSSRPEYRVAIAWLASELAIAASVTLTGGPRSAALNWLVLPVVTLAARFDTRGVVAGSGIVAALLLASTVGVDSGYILSHPQSVVFPLGLLAGIALLSLALMRSDLQHRNDSVIDPLTTMLNRNALRTRVDELRHQAELVGEPVGVILADLDHFKQINDAHGHAIGDRVLQSVAYTMRKKLRAFDLAYRLGGEEFLVLLPAANLTQTTLIAEDLRQAIAATPHAGIAVTISLGAAASAPGKFDYSVALNAADRALYTAKAAGRDQVYAADGPEHPQSVNLPPSTTASPEPGSRFPVLDPLHPASAGKSTGLSPTLVEQT